MIIKSYNIKSEYTRIRDGNEISYHRYKLIHDIRCDSCGSEFTETLDKGRRNSKHMCPECRGSNNFGPIRRQYIKDKEDPAKIGEKRLHKGSKYPEVYVGVDSWHTKVQGHWCREHVFVIEEDLGHKIPEGHVVHHIDGNKRNNNKKNLILLTVEEHNNAHAKSEQLIFQLVQSGFITFNRHIKLYEFS
jgi:hypothetical protein